MFLLQLGKLKDLTPVCRILVRHGNLQYVKNMLSYEQKLFNSYKTVKCSIQIAMSRSNPLWTGKRGHFIYLISCFFSCSMLSICYAVVNMYTLIKSGVWQYPTNIKGALFSFKIRKQKGLYLKRIHM